MQNFSIRKAEPNDALMLSKIGANTFYHTFRPYNTEEDMQLYISKSYGAELMEKNLHNNSIHYFLCMMNDECVGYIKLVEGTSFEGIEPNSIELEKIYLVHTVFGTDAGKLLMQKAIDFAKSHNFNSLFLGVWQQNERAVAFYKKNGFETVATRQFKLGETICDDFIMSKKIR